MTTPSPTHSCFCTCTRCTAARGAIASSSIPNQFDQTVSTGEEVALTNVGNPSPRLSKSFPQPLWQSPSTQVSEHGDPDALKQESNVDGMDCDSVTVTPMEPSSDVLARSEDSLMRSASVAGLSHRSSTSDGGVRLDLEVDFDNTASDEQEASAPEVKEEATVNNDVAPQVLETQKQVVVKVEPRSEEDEKLTVEEDPRLWATKVVPWPTIHDFIHPHISGTGETTATTFCWRVDWVSKKSDSEMGMIPARREDEGLTRLGKKLACGPDMDFQPLRYWINQLMEELDPTFVHETVLPMRRNMLVDITRQLTPVLTEKLSMVFPDEASAKVDNAFRVWHEYARKLEKLFLDLWDKLSVFFRKCVGMRRLYVERNPDGENDLDWLRQRLRVRILGDDLEEGLYHQYGSEVKELQLMIESNEDLYEVWQILGNNRYLRSLNLMNWQPAWDPYWGGPFASNDVARHQLPHMPYAPKLKKYPFSPDLMELYGANPSIMSDLGYVGVEEASG